MFPIGVRSQDSLEEAVRAAGIDVPPRFLETTSSTNTEALALAEAGAPEWTIVAAGHQTAGRGRLGRTWLSLPGKSLLASLVLRPQLPPARAPLVSLLAAAKMVDACRVAEVKSVRTKWPNDLVVGERKLGGLLAEAKVLGGVLNHVVLGIGVNVMTEEQDFPEELRGSVTSVAIEGGAANSSLVLMGFLAWFRSEYRPNDPEFGPRTLDAYRTLCTTLGRRVRATTVRGDTVEGTAVDLDDDGGLIVRTDGRDHVVAFGEVAHLD